MLFYQFIKSKQLKIYIFGLPQIDQANLKTIQNLAKNSFFSISYKKIYNVCLLLLLFNFYMSIRNIQSLKAKIIFIFAIFGLLFLKKVLIKLSYQKIKKEVSLIIQNKNLNLEEYFVQYKLSNSLNQENCLILDNLLKQSEGV